MKQTFTIPYKPDSVNSHWMKTKTSSMCLSPAGKKFRENVQWFIKTKKYKTFKNKVRVNLELYFKDNRERDIDNYFKAILDSFNGFLYEDDRLIYEINSKKFIGVGKNYFIIEVEEL